MRDRAVSLLEGTGISVISSDASIKTRPGDPFRVFKTRLALFLHFDGSENGTSGASVGYDDDSDRGGAEAWKELYGKFLEPG